MMLTNQSGQQWRQAARGMAVVSGMALLLWAGAAIADAQEKLPPAEKIMEKTIEARGGRAAFEKLTSRVSKGRLTMEMGGQTLMDGALRRWERAPNDMYVEISIAGGGGMIRSGCYEGVCWSVGPRGNATVMEGEDKEERLADARFNELLYWKDMLASVETVAKETADGKSCYKVRIKPKAGKERFVYYNRKNGLPVKMVETNETPNGTATMETVTQEYRVVDGVKIPTKIVRTIKVGEQEQVLTFTYETIEHNVDIPDSKFRPPSAVDRALEESKEKSDD